MFRKLNPVLWEWQTAITISIFVFTLAVFGFFIIRALRMKRDESERMSLLPVKEDNDPTEPKRHEHSV
jgi:DMSO reductase anchor subunit